MTLDHVEEEGTLIVPFTFTDDEGNAVVPNAGSLAWSLVDPFGTVVNGRAGVAIASASTVTIVLTGPDLVLNSTLVSNTRILYLKGTYNSSAGSNLNIKKEHEFVIDNLTGET